MDNNQEQMQTISNEQLIQALTADTRFTELLMERIWSQVFFWATFFESLDGYTQTLSGGSISIAGTDVVLSTGATSGNSAELIKQPSWQGVSTFYAKNMFRTAAVFNANTAQEIYIVHGSLSGKYYGFKVSNGTLYGVVNDGTTETTTELQAIAVSTSYNLEAVYYPKEKILFYVNTGKSREPAGIITSGLMKPEASVNTTIMDVKITTNEAVDKSVQLSFWQFLQSRTYNE